MREKRSYLVGGLAFFGGVSILAALAVLVVAMYSRKQLENYRASLEKRGEKLTVEELIPPKPSGKYNGAQELNAVANEIQLAARKKTIEPISPDPFEISPGLSAVRHTLPTAERGGKETSWASIETDLQEVTLLLEKLRKASYAPCLEFDPDYRLGLNAPIADVERLAGAAKLLNLQTMLLLHEGDVSTAVENIRTLLRLAEITGRQQTTYSQLITTITLATAVNTTWELLQSPEVPSADLAKLQTSWSAMRRAAFVGPTLRMWRAIGIPLFDDPSVAKSYAGFPTSRPASVFKDLYPMIKYGWWTTVLSSTDEKEFLKASQDLIDQIPPESGPWIPFQNALDRLQKADAKEKLSRVVTRNLTSGIAAQFKAIALAEVYKTFCITAIALRRYQQDHAGKLPVTFSELVPEYLAQIPADPMDGKPLRYHPSSDGDFRLYSVGADGVDDGGKPDTRTGQAMPMWPSRDLSGKFDIVWPTAPKP